MAMLWLEGIRSDFILGIIIWAHREVVPINFEGVTPGNIATGLY